VLPPKPSFIKREYVYIGQPPSSEGACHPTVIEASVADMKNGFGKP
jgi:hypothetical protein